MKPKYLIIIMFSVICCFFAIISLENTTLVSPRYSYTISNNVKKYIKEKYGDDISIDYMKVYSPKKGILHIDNIAEILIKPKNSNYFIFYDAKRNKIYDNKQFKLISSEIKKNIINNNTDFSSGYSIDDFAVYQASTNHFNDNNDYYFFDENCLYKQNEITDLLKNNNINISLDISFYKSYNIQSYRDICINYLKSIKSYFTGGKSSINLDVCKVNYYNNNQTEIPLCSIYSYQAKNEWYDNIVEENFVPLSNGISVSSLIPNYFFTSTNDCIFKIIPLSNKIKNYNNKTQLFSSNLYYFNYTDKQKNIYNLDTSQNLLIKLDKTIFENGKLYDKNYTLYAIKIEKDTTISSSIINSSNSYTDGQYMYIRLVPDSYLVLSQDN